MAHHTLRSSYSKLNERLNLMPQSVPPSDLLFKILRILFSEKEAELVAQMPIIPFTAKRASRIWNMDLSSAMKVLDELASRAILVDMELLGKKHYALPPPMAGFFEFSMMRIRKDIDQEMLAKLYYEYLNLEDDFVRALSEGGDTGPFRTFVNEPSLSKENELYILDYERASEIAKTSSHIAVGLCYCRHKMQHVQRACDAPMEVCLTFNITASSLSRHGHARQIDVSECLDIFQTAYDHNLLQIGENSQTAMTFICNCCGCCCEALLAQQRFGSLRPVQTTSFIPERSIRGECRGCGKCKKACPVNAMSLVPAGDPDRPKKKVSYLDEELCLGCGVCVNVCTNQALLLKSRPSRVIPPLTPVHRTVVMAIERGKLQNLILNNHVLLNHRSVAAVLSVIFALPPVKQIMANKQLNSRFLGAVIERGSDLLCRLQL